MKYIKRTIVWVFCFLFVFLTGCGSDSAEDFDGMLSPDQGEVIATIDGEDFHYAPVYLLFRDFAPYPEDPDTEVPSWTAYYRTYGEMAVGVELLSREAMANHYTISDFDSQRERYTEILDGGFQSLVEANTSTGDDFAREYQKGADLIFDVMDQVKEEYGLDSDKELAELTFPIYMKGYTASMYLWRAMSDYYGGDQSGGLTEEMSDAFWQEYYPELLEKYNVEWK